MPSFYAHIFEVWASDELFKRLVSETIVRMQEWKLTRTKPLVSVSGGKDSSVALHLALKVWDPEDLMIWHWDYGDWLMPRSCEDESRSIINQIVGGHEVKIIVNKRKGGEESRWTSHDGYKQFFGNLKKMLQIYERDCSIAGMRAEESIGRAQRVKHYSEYHEGTRVQLFHPLADWKAVDVWTYIISNKIPYHSTYDKKAALFGCYTSGKVRFVTFFDHEMDYLGAPNTDGILLWKDRHQTP